MGCAYYEALAQGEITTEYVTPSTLKDDDGNYCGHSGLFKVSARYTATLSAKRDSVGKVTAWSSTLKATYANFVNDGATGQQHPDNILNASLNLSHSKPVGRRWQLLATLGAGIYSSPHDVKWHSILAHGALIFAYRANNNLSIGIGGGLNNSYGVPLLLPMAYFNWTTSGRTRITIDMANGLKARASTKMGRHADLELTAIEMDAMSAVVKNDEGTRIFSSVSMRSTLSATYHFSPRTALYVGVGGNWLRSEKTAKRSLNGFFKNFGDDENKRRYSPSLFFSAGFRFLRL